jgi:dual specificity tyrosine-phosphorylation-regulated kinase 2/3/4
MTWKRSSSKASQRAQAAALAAQQDKDEQDRKQNQMPPPKIPASATWTSRNSTDTGSTRPSLDFRPRKASTSQNQPENPPTQQRPQAESQHQKADTMQPPPPYSDHRRITSRSSSSSILSPVQRMLGSKSSLSTLKNRNLDTNLDKDDLAADKIMEKLASKRKDFENAAKEVDELRRRAYPKERVSPSQAIQMVNLNIFERGEIIDYKEVYFCGTRNAKKHIGDLDVQTNNFGYDDERGDYNIVMGDHLAYRYEVVDMLGKGSFGQVVRCIDHKTGGLVAIKIIRNKKRFHQQALVEVNILQKLREWVNETS